MKRCARAEEKKGVFVKKRVTSSKHEKEGGEDYVVVYAFILLPELRTES